MHRHLACGASALALAAALSAGQALAQSAPSSSRTLTPVTVTGRAAGSPTQPDVEAQKRELFRTAGSVGFVDAEDYQGRFANTLRDVLKNTPGVFVQERYGQEIRLSMRGSGVARGYHLRGFELLQDGVPFNMADGSGDFYQIDPLALRSVEIYKGGEGLTYGSSTLGGAINAVTPTAYTAVAPTVLRLDGGSGRAIRGSAQASGISGRWDGLAVLSASRADGWRDHSDRKYLFLDGNAGYRLSDAVETRLYAALSDTRQKLPGALPLATALNAPRTATAAALAGDQARNQSVERLASRTVVTLSGMDQVEMDVWASHKHLDHPIFQVINQDGWTWGAALRYSGEGSLGGLDNALILGARYIGGFNNARQFVNLAGRKGAQTADADQKSRNFEVYGEDRLALTPTMTITAGGKFLSHRRELVNFRVPTNSASVTFTGFNPKVGLLWQAAPTVQLFADLTRSRDIPDFSDLVQAPLARFVPLEPQRAWTGEIGARGRYGPVAFDVTLYRANLRGELIQYTVGPDTPATTFNAGRTTHQGVEAWVRIDLLKEAAGGMNVAFTGLWNHNDFRFRSDVQYGDNRIAGTPPDVLRGELRFTRETLWGLRRAYLAPQVDWTPNGVWADQANTLRAPGYVLLGLETGFDLQNGASVFLEARNLTDKRYVSDVSTVLDARKVGTSIFYPGDGRGLYGGLRLAF